MQASPSRATTERRASRRTGDEEGGVAAADSATDEPDDVDETLGTGAVAALGLGFAVVALLTLSKKRQAHRPPAEGILLTPTHNVQPFVAFLFNAGAGQKS